jgi:hypothetical protein
MHDVCASGTVGRVVTQPLAKCERGREQLPATTQDEAVHIRVQICFQVANTVHDLGARACAAVAYTIRQHLARMLHAAAWFVSVEPRAKMRHVQVTTEWV